MHLYEIILLGLSTFDGNAHVVLYNYITVCEISSNESMIFMALHAHVRIVC